MSTESPGSRNIPLPIQRQVRQRCGFGCVICGLPLYEYDHLLGWSSVKRHVAEEITLLCDQHHREKTSGLLTAEEVNQASANPLNRQTGVSKPYDLHFTGDECRVVVGSNLFERRDPGEGTALVPILVDGVPLLSFVLLDGHLLLSMLVFDEANIPVLKIQDNVLMYSVSSWDIELVGRRLIIREAARQFLLDIRFEPPNEIFIERGRFLRNGVELLIRPEYVLITNGQMQFSSNYISGSFGIVIGEPSPGHGAVYIQHVSRYLWDRSEAIKWANENLHRTHT